MKSFLNPEGTFGGQPARLGPMLASVDIGKGREALYHDQVPELLRSLAEETKVASISASNALEGVIVDANRAESIVASGAPARFRNRSEREFAGYRDAIETITRSEQHEAPTVPFLLHIHREIFKYTDARGGFLKSDDNLIVSYESGRREVIFTPPPWQETNWLLNELVDRYTSAVADRVAHPLVLIAALILDFLAIHPVADGNGRVARILTTQQLLAAGYGVPRYASVEQAIFETKNEYYGSLRASQEHWYEGAHSIWPWTEYLVGILVTAYDDFEHRAAAARGLAGLNKQDRVRVWALEHAPDRFRLRDARRALPGISDPTISLVLRRLRDEGRLRATDGGPQSWWERT